MGKCVLNFDQIEIVSQKSDSRHSDNDWIAITWFVDDKVIRTDKFPLLSLRGGVGLQSGDGITPFNSEVECSDSSIATAAYLVTNLGSTDFTQQADAAAQIAENISEKLTQAYLKAVQIYLEGFSDLPFSDLAADVISEFAPIITQSVGAAFEDIIIPLLNDLISEFDVLAGHPNCNGPVFYDTAVFPPEEPVPDAVSTTHYSTSHVTGCSSSAETDVSRTLHRDLDVPPTFTNAPTPEVFFVPSQSESNWISPAAEDSTTSAPIVLVTIEPSIDVKAGSGLYTVMVKEQVDSRFAAVFEASAVNVPVTTIRVVTFTGNVPGTIRSWISRPFRPTELSVTALGVGATSTTSGGAKGKAAHRARGAANLNVPVSTSAQNTPRYSFTLGWENSQPIGSLSAKPVRFSSVASGIDLKNVAGNFLDTVHVLQLPQQGVTICLYENQLAGGERISYALRYMRAENLSYTRADWALVLWDPV